MPSASVDLIYVDPPFNTGRRSPAPASRPSATPPATAPASAAIATAPRPSPPPPPTATRHLRRLPRLPPPAPRRGPPPAHPHRQPLPPHRPPRGPLLQGPARRDLHPPLLPKRDHLGLRLRRPRHRPLARQARQHPLVHPPPRRLHLQPQRLRPHPLHGPQARRPDKSARGKTPTDVWWHTIVSPTGKEKTGYPTQKPLGILNRIVRVHSNPGDHVLDFFAGSGTTGLAAARHDRTFTLIDESPEAIAIMEKRLAPYLQPGAVKKKRVRPSRAKAKAIPTPSKAASTPPSRTRT